MHFIIEGARKEEPGLIVTFEENAAQLRRNAASFGWDIKSLEDDDMLHIQYPAHEDIYAGESLLRIHDCIVEFGVKRVLIDSINGFNDFSPDGDSVEYIQKSSRYLKSRNITTVFTNETRDLLGSTRVTEGGVSHVMDTVITLRYVEISSELLRAISVLKMRGSAHDAGIHETKITEQGMTVETDAASFKEYEGIFSGVPTLTRSEAFGKVFGRRR